MSNNAAAAPDSWEEADVAADSSASDLQQKLIKLNVNAAEFVPSFASFSSKSDEDGEPRDASAEKKPTAGSKSGQHASFAYWF